VARTCPRISPQLHQTGRSLPGPSSPRSQLIRPPRARSHPAPSQRLLKSWLDQFPLRFYTQTTPKHPRRCASIPLAARHARNPRTRPHPSGFSCATPRPAPAATRDAKSCIPAGSPLLIPAAPAAGFSFRSYDLRLHLARSLALLISVQLRYRPGPAPSLPATSFSTGCARHPAARATTPRRLVLHLRALHQPSEAVSHPARTRSKSTAHIRPHQPSSLPATTARPNFCSCEQPAPLRFRSDSRPTWPLLLRTPPHLPLTRICHGSTSSSLLLRLLLSPRASSRRSHTTHIAV
jgi:hypothetical protein